MLAIPQEYLKIAWNRPQFIFFRFTSYEKISISCDCELILFVVVGFISYNGIKAFNYSKYVIAIWRKWMKNIAIKNKATSWIGNLKVSRVPRSKIQYLYFIYYIIFTIFSFFISFILFVILLYTYHKIIYKLFYLSLFFFHTSYLLLIVILI